jgi:hypothetical protein
MRASRIPQRLCLLALIVFFLSGCGRTHETLYPVVGRVTFQGRPVAAGIIRFSNPKIGIDTLADLRPDGTYEVVRAHGPGLPAGKYRVAILPPRVDMPLGATRPPPSPECSNIPNKYRDPTTSGLTHTVTPDNKDFDVNML